MQHISCYQQHIAYPFIDRNLNLRGEILDAIGCMQCVQLKHLLELIVGSAETEHLEQVGRHVDLIFKLGNQKT